MSKVLRTAGMVVAAVALVATTAGLAAPAVAATATTAASAGGIAGISAATLTAIGTYGSLAAGVLSVAAAATAPGFSVQGNKTNFTTNPQSGLPYAMGRTRMSGLRIYANTNTRPGYTKFNDLLWFGAMLSIGGPIDSIEKFTADNELVTFDASGNAIGTYQDYQAQKIHLGGGPMASALSLSLLGGHAPGWTSEHKLSGITHAMWCLRFNKQGDIYGAGAPEPAWIGKWVKVYDPRKDSTYPGGSGSHRALDESTYEWSANPGLHALTWALGRWQNGKRICGIGAPVDTIRVAEFVECANVCDANGWTAGGVEWTTDSKWDTLKRILQAGGAKPTQTGAMIGCLVSTPRTAIATIESRHLLDGLSLSMTKSRRDRFNSVIPRYVDEDSDWAVVSGTAITVPDYVTADGGQRTKEIDFPLVQVFSGNTATQPGQLAAYEIVNSREAGPFTFTTGPEWIGIKTGDVIYLDVPEEGLDTQPVLVTKRAIDPATGKVSFTVETETYSKHAFALGQTTVPPAPFSLTAPDLKPGEPDALVWSITGTTSGEGFPALLVAGESEMPSADALVIDYRLHDAADWTNSAIVSAVEPIRHVIAPLESETAYDVRISYRVGSIDGNYTVFSNVITGVGKLTTIESQVGDHDAEIAQLEADTAQAELDIAAAQTNITSLQSDAAALQTDLTAAQANILSAQADILANSDDIATVNTTLSSHGASITSLQTTASSHAGQIATLTTQVTAGRQNLLPNGDFSNGLTGWTTGGAGGWSAVDSWTGRRCTTSATGIPTLLSPKFPVTPGPQITAGVLSQDNRPTNSMYMQFRFEDASGGNIAYGDYVNLADNTLTRVYRTTTVPAGAAFCRIYFSSPASDSGYVEINNVTVVVGTVDTPNAPSTAIVTQAFSAISTLDGEYASLSTTVGTQGASITTLQSAMSVAQGDIASLETDLSTANANISTNASAITGINSSIASINSTISTQGSSIATNASAITTIQGNVSSLTTQVTAGRQNLLQNGDFSNGLTGWTPGGAGGWTIQDSWTGRRCITNATGIPTLLSPSFKVTAGGTITVGVVCQDNRPTSSMYIQCRFEDSGGGIIWGSSMGLNKNSLARKSQTFTVPSGAVTCRLWVASAASDTGYVELNNITVVIGSYDVPNATPTATAIQSFQALSTLNSQYASLSSTVSTQGVTITSQQTAITTIEGNVTTLFGRAGVTVDVNGNLTGWEINNNGTTGEFKIRADRFQIVPTSGSGARTEYSDGSWRVYDSSGVLRVRLGKLS